MAKIDLEKWICSMIECFPDFKESNKIPCMYQQALKDQGLEYKDGQIVEINSSNGGKKSSEDIPFGDSELIANEYTIPEGYTAEIKDGKVIIQKAKPFEIKAGHWYMCIRNFNDAFDNRAFTEGMIYKSTKNGTLIPDNSNCPYRICVPDHYFRLATIPHEPKFKVGDFVINDYCMGRVIKLTKDAYLLDTEQSIPFSYEHNVRLWTIKDAKDGDVLVVNEGTKYEWIGLFKEHTGGTFTSHCHINKYTGELVTNSARCKNHGCGKYTDIHPATPEQRDFLFKKIIKAGYVWDAEKKELKEVKSLYPLYKVGDWITRDNTDIPVQIIEVKDYYVCDLLGNCNIKLAMKDVHHNFHLWSIEDAEDGDIISDGTNACIFRKVIDDGDGDDCWVNSYCGFTSEGHFVINSIDAIWCPIWDCAPATQSQREKLFKAIKEAGYEWNSTDKILLKKP